MLLQDQLERTQLPPYYVLGVVDIADPGELQQPLPGSKQRSVADQVQCQDILGDVHRGVDDIVGRREACVALRCDWNTATRNSSGGHRHCRRCSSGRRLKRAAPTKIAHAREGRTGEWPWRSPNSSWNIFVLQTAPSAPSCPRSRAGSDRRPGRIGASRKAWHCRRGRTAVQGRPPPAQRTCIDTNGVNRCLRGPHC